MICAIQFSIFKITDIPLNSIIIECDGNQQFVLTCDKSFLIKRTSVHLNSIFHH